MMINIACKNLLRSNKKLLNDHIWFIWYLIQLIIATVINLKVRIDMPKYLQGIIRRICTDNWVQFYPFVKISLFCKLHVNKRIKHNLITLLLNVRKGEENGLKLLKGIIVSKFRQLAKKINTKGFDGFVIIIFFIL